MTKVGDLIYSKKSGTEYEVIKIFPGNYIDIKRTKPLWYFNPDYLPVYLSVHLSEFDILKERE